MDRTNEYLIKEYDNKDTKSYQWLEMKGQMEKQNSHGRVKKKQQSTIIWQPKIRNWYQNNFYWQNWFNPSEITNKI